MNKALDSGNPDPVGTGLAEAVQAEERHYRDNSNFFELHNSLPHYRLLEDS